MADLDDMYNPHEDAEPFLRNVLRHGPELAPSLHRLVVLLRDTLPIAKVLEEIRRDSNTTRGPDWFAKSAGWYRLVYGDLRFVSLTLPRCSRILMGAITDMH